MVLLALQLKVVVNCRFQQKNSTRRGYTQPCIFPFSMKKQNLDARVCLKLVACVEFLAHIVIDTKEGDVVGAKCL